MYSVNLAEADQIVATASSEQLKVVRPDAKYRLFATGGHAPHWENSERFNQELAEFARYAIQNAPALSV